MDTDIKFSIQGFGLQKQSSSICEIFFRGTKIVHRYLNKFSLIPRDSRAAPTLLCGAFSEFGVMTVLVSCCNSSQNAVSLSGRFGSMPLGS